MPRMHSPAHPGQILEELYIRPHNLTITEVASMPVRDRRDLTQVYNSPVVDQNLCSEQDVNPTA